jgi:hypothetical protein
MSYVNTYVWQVSCLFGKSNEYLIPFYFLFKKTSEHAKEDAVDLKNTQLRMEREKQVSLLSVL